MPTGMPPPPWRFPVAIAGAAVAGAWAAHPLPLAVVAVSASVLVIAVAGHARRWAPVTAVVAAVLACGLSGRAWLGTAAIAPGPFNGTVVLRTDPVRVGAGVRATGEVVGGAASGRHLGLWTFGRVARRLDERAAGERVAASGAFAPPPAEFARQLAARHVVGRLDVDVITGWTEGSPRPRLPIGCVASSHGGLRTLPPDGLGLYLGMVLGDDRAQPPDQLAAFRGAGLSHLTAVSGQNVALLLVIVGPLLRRLRPGVRLGATVVVIAWFALLTRFEPSVMRATAMAALAAVTVFLGRPSEPVRLLCVAVAGLVLVDPLLVWSVGFWLSVGATGGIAVLAGPLATRLPGPRPFAEAAAVSLAAQVGVAAPSIAVFGGVPLASVPVNVLAAPLAAAVMIYGLPAGRSPRSCRTRWRP